MIADGLSKTTYLTNAGRVAVWLCAGYSLMDLGLLIQMDVEA